MTIDAQTRAFLDRAAADPPPPPGTITLARFREALGAMTAFDHDYEPVTSVEDVAVDDGPTLRIYRPGAGVLPVVAWIHGGSWVRGSVAASDHLLRILANRSGCVVVGVDYRLPPESPFPAPIEDVRRALEWIGEHAAQLEAAPDAIAVGGESTGGNLAAAAALLARDRRGPVISHQLLLSPLLDAGCGSAAWQRLGTGYGLVREQLLWAVAQYAPGVGPHDPLLSPLAAPDLSDLPPALVVTGEYDPLHDDGERYAARLRAAGVRVEHVRYPGLIHHAIVAPKAIALGTRVLEETAVAIGEWVRGRDRGERMGTLAPGRGLASSGPS
ncbi:MAG: lipase [Solirubrobacterales bacterium]|nr:lipase [Solirubrobacterales bacterium]